MPPSRSQVLIAWSVHAFTASGALAALAALVEIAAGELGHAALWMLVALSIDSVDGFFARAADVSRVLPAIDGRRLDDLVDFLNYVIVPVVFMLAIGALEPPIVAAVPILASSYGFSQREAKTEDAFFLGWPSYWNVVAISVWLLELSSGMATAVVLVCAILVFVPLKYVYPSRMSTQKLATNLGALGWILLMAYASFDPERARTLRLPELSLLYPAYYIGISVQQGGWLRRGH
jgi:phosphatidylcholine synthase